METPMEYTRQNEPTPKSSPPETLTSQDSPNPMWNHLSEIVDKSRRLKGWTVLDGDSQRVVVNDWAEILNAARVPGKHYGELYLRCAAYRAGFLQAGKTPPDISAELMVSQYPALRQEIAQQSSHLAQQNAPVNKRYLVEDGRIKCHYCLGTGFRPTTRGNYKGVIKCQHEEDGYQFTDGDEIVGGDEGIRIIESYLARQGMEFNIEIKKVLYGKFGAERESFED